MRQFLRSALLFLALTTNTAAAVASGSSKVGSNNAHDDDQQIQDIIDWVRSEGGFVNDKVQIRRVDSEDPTSNYGMFAKEKIHTKERIMVIQSSSMMRHTDGEEFYQVYCGLTQMLLKEMRLGAGSKYASYTNYLLGQKYGQVPATWSDEGKDFLDRIMDGDEEGVTDWIENGFEGSCIQEGDAFEIQALALVSQKAYDNLLIPLYDIVNHSKDQEAINVECRPSTIDGGVRVEASREIPAGQELFTIFYACTDCGTVPDVTGSLEILRDYGFVEPYPRIFQLGLDDDILFSVHENKETKEPKVTWITEEYGMPDHDDIEWLKEYRRKLNGLRYSDILEAGRDGENPPQKERNIMSEYLQATLTAVDSAIETATRDLYTAKHEADCDKNGSCSVPWDMYADLDEPIKASDDEYFLIYQCETLVYGMNDFSKIENSESHYQSMDYYHDPKTKEMCFFIDGIHQQCTSYRPHYHEMGVHLPARYLPESLKRVLWIGGGDAMFLHEILKYPDLELAVGLELDQKVTRGAFKYFGAQPHWDNEKVQWWYGDASKSLLMLPEDYFGSFDMVLVDLSDTVLSLSVTKEMDIIGALSLLLKPDGIFVMNELFFKRVSQVFEHTVQVNFENVPKVCDQAFVLASNDINFLSRNLTSHQVENNIYIEPLSPEFYDRFDLVHDYYRNRDSGYKKLCKKSEKDNGEVIHQEGSPGIFMAVEVEEVTMDLRSTKNVQDAVTKALEQEGFKVDSVLERTASEFYKSASDEIIFTLREGYIAIRTWAEHKYCAFDIHLWGSFEKHEAAKKAVVVSVGGKMETTSSYRIVAGGMFGVSTWKDDAKVHGPQMDKLCDRSEAPNRDAQIDPSTVEVALEAALRLSRHEVPIIAAVVCGGSEACATIDMLKKNGKVGQVIVLMCPELKPGDENFQDGPERAIACEKEILKAFQESLTDEKLLGAVVVDGGATRLMGKIVLKILTGSKNSSSMQILAPNMLAIATIDNETESWRRKFLSRIHLDIVKLDPVFRAELLFNTTDHSMELGITASGDEHFIHRLVGMVADVEKESGLSVEVRRFNGGLWRSSEKTIMDDSDADHVYSHESYNRTAPMEQWRSQTPLAHQSLLQFETRPVRVGDNVVVTFTDDDDNEMFEGIIRKVNNDDTYAVKFKDGDSFNSVERIEIRKVYGSPNDEMLTATQVKNALKNALSSMPFAMMAEHANVEELASAGDGSVLSAFWPGGSMLLMWDGRTHFDINIVTYIESSRLAEDLAINLKEEISGLETILRDEQPRGFGRVVNFKRDLKKSMDPYWA